MAASEFQQIVKSFCKDACLQDHESILAGKPFIIHQCPTWLWFIEIADLCRIVIDLGMPADGISPRLGKMMLESNCSSKSKYLPFFGISEKNGHVLLMLHISLSILREEISLYFILDQQLLPVIAAWRKRLEHEGKFLDEMGKALVSFNFA
ncbi:hypothetical protein ABC383_00310 [Noviherbaspirillum sp. 1P10PC]|uniref:hypothetical protein n=1 Tax=Noviherbaspirillum sp. 1P10PC TaxID=3132292 RepID=UPI00399F1103